MKNLFILTFLIAIFCVNPSIGQKQEFLDNIYKFIEDPGVFSLNQEKAHVPLMPFQTLPLALENDWQKSGAFLSLNGDWKFKWSENPELSPKDFYTEKFNDSKWAFIKVPGNWEMQGYGDPVFRNVSQPFVSRPPFIPHDYNPVGSYRKTLYCPVNGSRRRYF